MRINKRRSDEQQQRERHFDDDQRGSRLVVTERRPRAAGAVFQRGAEIGPRALQRRQQPEEDSGANRESRGEQQHAPVEPNEHAVLTDARHSGCVDRQQRADAEHAEAESEDATHHRQRHAFGQQLPDDASAAGADGGSQGNFTLAGRGTHQQQVRDVGAGNEQHEGDGGAENEQRGPRAPDKHRLHALETETSSVAERVRELRRVFRGGQLQPRLPLLERHASLETSRRLEEVALIDRVRIELERHPQLRRLSDFGQVERGTDDADDFVWIAAELNRLPDDVGIAPEPARPQPVAEHGDAGTSRQIFLARKRSTLEQRRAKQLEVVRAHLSGPKLLGDGAAGVVDDVRPIGGRVLNDRRLLPPVRELRRRRDRTALSLPIRAHEEHDVVGLRERQRLQQHRAHDREDRGIGTDAKRQRRDRRGREHAVLAKHPERVSEILQEEFHVVLRE